VLGLLFIVQFVVACACLAIGPSQQKSLFHTGWYEAEGLRGNMQRQFDCCGAFPESDNDTDLSHPPCNLTSVSLCACYVDCRRFCIMSVADYDISGLRQR